MIPYSKPYCWAAVAVVEAVEQVVLALPLRVGVFGHHPYQLSRRICLFYDADADGDGALMAACLLAVCLLAACLLTA